MNKKVVAGIVVGLVAAGAVGLLLANKDKIKEKVENCKKCKA